MIPSEIRTRRLAKMLGVVPYPYSEVDAKKWCSGRREGMTSENREKPHRSDNACAALLGDYEVVKMLSRVPYPSMIWRADGHFLTGRLRVGRHRKQADELPFHIDHDGQMIGAVGFRKLQETPRIGYWLGQPYWGQGFMSEAVLAALQWLFRTTGHNRVVSEAMKTNVASLAIMKKWAFAR
jgi:RimJ/RimL family protein N-acetyltransferase